MISGHGINDYAFTGGAPGVTVEYLTVEDFVSPAQQGVVNHTAGTDWTIEHDTVQTNPDGAAVMIGSHDIVEYDCLTHNGQYGFSAYSKTGVTSPTLSHDEISYNDGSGGGGGKYDQGGTTTSCGCSGGGKFWQTKDAVVTTNWVHDNGYVGIWVDTDNQGFLISGNYVAHNYAEGIMYEISYNALISDNTLLDNAWGKGPAVGGFPIAAIYISESGGDPRVQSAYAGALQISGNVLRTNWGGVVLWENANRACGYTDGTHCTLVTSSSYTHTSCKAHLVGSSATQVPDYYDNCRWKTRTVTVTHDTFSYTPTDIPSCTTTKFCGFNGLFSEYGSVTPWKAWGVPLHISDLQNDRFKTNVYSGPWHFDGFAQGDRVSWTQWTKGFTDWNGSHDHFGGQDAGSTYT